MPDRECQCDNCKWACRNKPGWFLPEQMDTLAQHFGLSLKEVFDKYLSVDWWNAAEGLGDTFLISPAVRDYAGEQFPADPHGRCVFLTNDSLCSIYSVRPFECREYYHDQDLDTVHNRHREVAAAWTDYQGLIVELLGRQPYAETWSLFDAVLSGLW